MRSAFVVTVLVLALLAWDSWQPADLPAWVLVLPGTYVAGMLILRD